jgi:hypothetical protein
MACAAALSRVQLLAMRAWLTWKREMKECERAKWNEGRDQEPYKPQSDFDHENPPKSVH